MGIEYLVHVVVSVAIVLPVTLSRQGCRPAAPTLKVTTSPPAPVLATSRISKRFRGFGALPLRAHAPSRARAHRRGDGRLSPSQVAAHGDRPAPTPTRHTAALGRQAAGDAV